jgi:uncharacterized damage-inducible protein DinB
MAWNNAWANHRLHAACAGLDDAAYRAGRTSFFPSIALTLNHIRLIDLFYIDALEGGTLGHAAFAEHDAPPPFAEVRAAQALLDRRLIAYCDRLDAEGLAREIRVHRPDHVQVEPADRLLLHLFQHDVHHRGQVHAMLAGTGVAPPQLDEFFSAADLPLRAGELAALAVTEAAIWGPGSSATRRGDKTNLRTS